MLRGFDDVSLRAGDKLLSASSTAEMILLGPVSCVMLGLARIDRHAAHRIDNGC